MERKTIRLEVSTDNEGTAAPYWLILDPRQMMSPDPMALSTMITGPFFSREEAEAHLLGRRYNFSHRAVVWCASGHWSEQYKVACRNADISK